MRIYCGIDGTDNEDLSPDAVQCLTLAALARHDAGFVKRVEHLGFSQSKYLAGTKDSFTGASSADIIKEAVDWVRQSYGASLASTSDTKVYLGGFSRGGAAALCVAHELKEHNIPVQEMYLFDAVDRSTAMNNDKTSHPPSNVGMAFHAMRHPKTRSRVMFGNCGKKNVYNNLATALFETTHGGVGGWPNGASKVKRGIGTEDAALFAPFVSDYDKARALRNQDKIHEDMEPFPTSLTPEQEAAGMQAAWNWMTANMFKTSGINLTM